jgi:integral membrane protein (TIGR01906 family)
MRLQRAILVAIAVAVAAVLIGTALLIVVHPWTADAAYVLPWFPEPRIDLGDDERSRLAAVGTLAIQPWRADGIEAMRAARLDDGRRAFDGEEIAHFEDVRRVVVVFVAAWAAGLAVIAAAALVGDRSLVRRALGAGARFTLALVAGISLLMLVSFRTFFEGFHAIFFEGDTWRLPESGTARSLYPDAFWAHVGGAMVALVLAQAVALLVAVRPRARREEREVAARPGTSRTPGTLP